MNKKKVTRLIRAIRERRAEETPLGSNSEEYLRNLRKKPRKVEKLLIEAGIYQRNKQGKLVLTKRYR